MTTNVKHNTNHAAVLSLCSVAVTALGVIAGPAMAHADDCPGGLVYRNAKAVDQVCVTQTVATEVQQENAKAPTLRVPGGGAYGPLTCESGYVWREAFVGDSVCVTPQRRQETWDENAAYPPDSRVPAWSPAPRPPSQPPANSCDPRVDICVH